MKMGTGKRETNGRAFRIQNAELTIKFIWLGKDTQRLTVFITKHIKFLVSLYLVFLLLLLINFVKFILFKNK